MSGLRVCILCWILAAQCAWAQDPSQVSPKHGKSPSDLPVALQQCIASASQHHGVNSWVLSAILSVESGFEPRAVNRNSNQSLDVGMGQHNSMHFAELARYGIAPKDLFDPCIAIYVAAWHLARNIKKFGNTWFGIAAYHSATPCFNLRYQGLVWNKLVNWGAVQGSTIQVSQLKDCRLAKGPTNFQSTSQQTASMVVYDNASN